MIWFLAALALLVAWLIAVPFLGYVGIRRLRGPAANQDEGTVAPPRGLDLGLAVVVGLLPVAAWRLAVITTGWVDTDNDGMLDGFVMGQYDLGDIVLPEAVRWGVALAATTTIAYVVIRRAWSSRQAAPITQYERERPHP